MQLNAREAMHLSSCAPRPRATRPTGPCQEMHRLIAEQAGHHAVAEAMRFVDHSEPELERLEAERRAEVPPGSR